MKNLVIVESPTKAKTIAKFLGKDFKVESSFGHIRDLPKSKLGVDVDNNFKPQYVVPAKSKAVVNKLKKLAEKSNLIYFATDEDREGEAISWHLATLLKSPEEKIKRIVFHEITEEAIEEALKNPRGIDLNLVDAQQARRILDRLVGYQLSPFLWKKVARGLSAGRVQSVAVRLIVEREREIQAFKTVEYWSIDAKFKPTQGKPIEFEAKLNKINNKVIDKLEIKDEASAKKIVDDLKNARYLVSEIEKKETRKNPLPPFTTSTLQQTANQRLGFSAKQTMRLAQQLYEGVELGSGGAVGLITYMRTDSVNLADKFLGEVQPYIKNKFGASYTTGPKKYQAKSRLVQEAHEAIRPTSASNDLELVKQYLDVRQFKLYQLIWQRALASQMSPAIIDNTRIDIEATNTPYSFRATGSVIKFDGYLKVYPNNTQENILPALKEKEVVELIKLSPEQHFTQPPARYSEATLVKALEEYGIGRPSTYAPTIATIQERGYVEKEEKRLKPTDIAFLVNDLLVEHFPKIVDFKFTAHMEDDLDEIAEGKMKWQPVIHGFWGPFKQNLEKKDEELSKKELTEQKSDEVCEKCGKPMVIKVGRFGRFLACTGYPECKNTKPLNGENGEPPAPPEKTGEKCPECGSELVKRKGRYGEFVGCSNYPKCRYIKKEPVQEFGTCPQCGKGKIVGKRSRRGFFYACNQYPECKFALWGRPYLKEGKTEPEKCPKCNSVLVYGPKDTIKCSNKECKYKS
ncbi:MAG: DNA topoisomerase I [Candidatus Buchananbacteria bacterium RIFCSPHIGHO2_02_FULL_38_8]|uniref:DNA topoisomerase 1 n=2 Tax=Candidatus Buchananiibacteriota TaxID=1817903 RepID=A0A1G1XY95_9BACT|nr:MAG: DNA topoisomerase I [Candidatus Buchananbacteria bacterium RIFCSPHIGHO2_01_FULL_39_8]OGY46812.1 MAG: DNA topoisomerase I [Candidatus Buchananbacteria bacterium RIFCSPHIGHO2_02_FULL_38_8]